MSLNRYIPILLSMMLFLCTSLNAKELTQEERNKIAINLIPIINMLLMEDVSVVTFEERIILEKIEAYAEDNSNDAPLLKEYRALGIQGITAENLFGINQKIASLHATDVESVAKIQDLIDAYNDVTAPVITLNGSKTVTLAFGAIYTEQGATAIDDVDGKVSVGIGGDKVDTSVVKRYTVIYTAKDKAGNSKTETRVIIVQKEVVVEPEKDKIAPIVTLNGNANILTSDIDGYTEEGATAIDNLDGVVAVKIKGDKVDVGIPKTYTVIYAAEDKEGNVGTATRTVKVIDCKVVNPITGWCEDTRP